MGRLLFSLVLLLLLGALAWFVLNELEVGGPDIDRSRSSAAGAAGAAPSNAPGDPAPSPGGVGPAETRREAVHTEAEPPPEPPEATEATASHSFELRLSVVRRVDLQPVGGAECRLTAGYLGDMLRSGTSGPDGRFTTTLDPGDESLFLVVRKEGFLQQVRLLDPAAVGSSDFQVILDPGVPLRGQVLDGSTRQPLAGAEIEAYLESDFAELAEGIFADREGRFLVPGVPTSKVVTLTASLEGYRVGGLSRSFEAAWSDLLLLLFRGAVVEGVVYASDGRPAASARVTVEALPVEGGSAVDGFEEHQTVSDERGRFRIPALAFPARYSLRAASDLLGVGRAEPFDLVRDGQVVQRDIQLLRGGTELAILVLDSAGRAVSDLSMRLLDSSGTPPRSTETGAIDWNRGFAFRAGWHVYAPLPAGRYQVIAERPGWPARSIRIDVEAGRRNEATILLESGVALVGRVRNQAGAPQASIPLEFIYAPGESSGGLDAPRIERLIQGDDRGLVRVGAVTDEQGRFRLEGLPRESGAVLVGDPLGRAGGPGSEYALLIENPVMPGGAELELVLLEAPRVIGRFDPPTGLGEVSCLVQSGATASGRAVQVDGQGRFELPFPRVGVSFDLVLEHEAGAPFFIPDLVLAAGETLDLGRLKIVVGGSVEGRVADSKGRPMPGVAVNVAVGDWIWWRETETDGQGRFRLDGLPAVPGELNISSEEHIEELFQLESLGGAHRRNVVLYRPGRLDGRLLDSGGNPRAEVSVEARFQGSDPETAQWSDDALTDEQGRFSLLLRPGRYLVLAAGSESSMVEVVLEEGRTAEIRLGG